MDPNLAITCLNSTVDMLKGRHSIPSEVLQIEKSHLKCLSCLHFISYALELFSLWEVTSFSKVLSLSL